MKLIADAGSTKIEWAVVDSHGALHTIFTTEGLNPALVPQHSLADELRKRLAGNIPTSTPIRNCYYYGAGCIPDVVPAVRCALTEVVGCSDVFVDSDLLGAARALFPRGKGIACILGTGSNSCLVDNGRIIDNIPPLGFILGDEASGASLGKRLIGDMLKRLLPAGMWDEWTQSTGLDYPALIHRVYRQPQANSFLAQQTRFIATHIHLPALDSMVTDEMGRFLDRNVLHYADASHLPVGFVGSLADVFRSQLERAAASRGLTVSKIITRPLQGLIEFHNTH